jgi:hypothetical protein
MFDLGAKGWNRGASILCCLCVLFVLVAAAFAVYRCAYLKHAVLTRAKITNLIESKDKDGDKLYAPVYVFTDQRGESVKVISSTASFPPAGEVGDTIEVLYDPANPRHSIQNTFFSIWGLPTILGGLSLVYIAIFAAIAFFAGRHLKKQSEPTSSPNGGSAMRPDDLAARGGPPLVS